MPAGMISTYNATTPAPGPNTLVLMVAKRFTMRGFLVGDHADRKAAFREEGDGYERDGRIRVRETVVDGIARAPEAFLALLRGDHIGKMVVVHVRVQGEGHDAKALLWASPALGGAELAVPVAVGARVPPRALSSPRRGHRRASPGPRPCSGSRLR
jgi:hypothetical protein